MRVSIARGGESWDLSESTPFQVVKIDNLGPARTTRITERGAAQDGDSDLGMLLEPRMIPIVLQARSSISYPYESNRTLLAEIFRATETPLKLLIEFDSGAKRQIDTHSVGDVKTPLEITALPLLREAIMLRAANPTFYDPTAVNVTFALQDAGQTAVPTFVPTYVSGSDISAQQNVIYTGTWRDYPLITITGPITNPLIQNSDTYLLEFPGVTIASGSYYTLDLRFGRKRVYKNGDPNDNRIHELSLGSHIDRFAIEPKPKFTNGLNYIYVQGSGATNATSINIQYYRRYNGI